MYKILALLAAFIAVFSSVSGGVGRTWVSGPIVFITFGLIVGPFGLGFLSETTNPELLKSLAELTLALVLFTDAAGADFSVLSRTRKLPIRLLAVGLPLTIFLGFGFGWLLFGSLSVLQIAILATMLAPTDAALGKPVITNESVPSPIRQSLNVESGLNDGICVPILFLFLALAQGHATSQLRWPTALGLFAEEVGIGLVSGVVLTAAAVWWLRKCRRRGWLLPTWINITVIALALTCFATAQALGGSGFIASFAGGLLFGRLLTSCREEFLGAAEGIGDTFALLTWVYFGSAVLGQAAPYFNWSIMLYAVLSLTVIRMLPVFIAVAGMGLDSEGKFFLGWFGPRGLASIVFAVIVIDAEVPHSRELAMGVACTVILSIIAHGVTANPWARSYGRRAPRETDSGGSPSKPKTPQMTDH